MKDNKIQYQIVSVLNPKIEDKEKEEVINRITSRVEQQEAKVVKSDHWGNKELVYEIQGSKKGDFWVLDVESEKPLELKNFNVFLNREPNVIRYLILKK
ncbi:MAG: 30S ribosomal protein S6 [Patescibacteria group bacterium]|jgi:ribosomal protein S6